MVLDKSVELCKTNKNKRKIVMTNKVLTGECSNCESTYTVEFMEEMVSQELPEHCPFCGEIIEELSEDYIEDDEDNLDTGEWD
jgi:predicted  nucleic acid-binding Zn-ribbon protein